MSPAADSPEMRIALFQRKQVRRTIHNNEWWFVITDVVAALTDSTNPSDYLKKMRKRDPFLGDAFKGGGQIIPPLALPFETPGGIQRLQCWNTEGLFRLIQSIPSPKAEPFKRWLAKVGYERIQEIQDPELATKRIRALYKAKGYSDEWIEKRMRSIAIRDELTDEWKKRGVKEQREYAILTAEHRNACVRGRSRIRGTRRGETRRWRASQISQAAFGLTPAEYARHKKLDRQNLRDHMTDLELIFSMLGEASTTEHRNACVRGRSRGRGTRQGETRRGRAIQIARSRDTRGFSENKHAAHQGGSVAGHARKELEKKTGRKVVTSDNYVALAPGDPKREISPRKKSKSN